MGRKNNEVSNLRRLNIVIYELVDDFRASLCHLPSPKCRSVQSYALHMLGRRAPWRPLVGPKNCVFFECNYMSRPFDVE
jgi:hypothetical protein